MPAPAVDLRRSRARPRLLGPLAAALLIAVAAARGVDACTTFCVVSNGHVLFGRNYDFAIGRGLVMTNPRGLSKEGHRAGGPRWTSIHGSVTFNQFGREFPMGGMNEAGLVVELMWLDKAEYPPPDGRAPLGVLEWIQYQLDTASTIDDLIRSDATVRIEGPVPLHYLVADRSGRAATIEFLDGRLVTHANETLPVSVLANSTYEQSLDFWRRKGGVRGSSSDARFARAAEKVTAFAAADLDAAVARAFAILADSAQRETRWSIVYDQTGGVIRFRTDQQQQIRTIRVAALDFSCERAPRVLDVHAPLAGDVTSLMPEYTEAANRTLVQASYHEFRYYRFTSTREEIEAVVTHPARATCEAHTR